METPLPSLHSSFALLGASRSLTDHAVKRNVTRFSGSELDTIVYAQDTKRHGQPPVGYYLCKKKLLEHYKQESFAIHSRFLYHEGAIDDKLARVEQKATYHTHFFEMLSYFVQTYVKLQLVPHVHDNTIVLYFLDAWEDLVLHVNVKLQKGLNILTRKLLVLKFTQMLQMMKFYLVFLE